jgi:hypothetical protein
VWRLKRKASRLFEIARVFVRFDRVPRFILNANPQSTESQRIGNQIEAVIPTGERSGLQTHIATMESDSLCVRMKS